MVKGSNLCLNPKCRADRKPTVVGYAKLTNQASGVHLSALIPFFFLLLFYYAQLLVSLNLL